MSLEKLMEKYLSEGTWSTPQTEKAAKELEKLFQKPIKGERCIKGFI